MIATLTCRTSIRAVHTLESEVDEQGQPLVHGHHCPIDISLSKAIDPITGMMFSRELLEQCVFKIIRDNYDRKNLNKVLKVPSGENLAAAIFKDIENTEVGPYLIRIVVHETKKNQFITCRSPE